MVPLRWWLAAACLAACGRIGFDAARGDAATDAARGDAPSGDAATDALVPLGSWAIGSSNGDTVYSTADHTVQNTAHAADLVIAGCDHQASGSGGLVTMTVAPAGLVSLTTPLVRWDPASGYVTEIAWGIAGSAAGSGTTITVTFSGFGTFPGNSYSDCSVSLFDGGITPPTVVDTSNLTGGSGGLAQCGPIASVPGGLVYYFAARTTCVDAPNPPYDQLGATYGNTWGAWAPADGTSQGTTLADCGNSGGWLCSMVSLTP